MTATIAKPRSRKNIRAITNKIRELCDIQNLMEFPVVEFMEFALRDFFDGFTYDIIPDDEMGNCDGKTFPEKALIQIKESVYLGACAGNPRDRFTIAHEIGHLFLHGASSISYARVDNIDVKIKPYENPEWQANVFAAEILIPIGLVKELSAEEIADNCKVSYTAAKIQLEQTKSN